MVNVGIETARYLSVNSPDLFFELFFTTYFSLALVLGLGVRVRVSPNPMNMMKNMMLMSKKIIQKINRVN